MLRDLANHAHRIPARHEPLSQSCRADGANAQAPRFLHRRSPAVWAQWSCHVSLRPDNGRGNAAPSRQKSSAVQNGPVAERIGHIRVDQAHQRNIAWHGIIAHHVVDALALHDDATQLGASSQAGMWAVAPRQARHRLQADQRQVSSSNRRGSKSGKPTWQERFRHPWRCRRHSRKSRLSNHRTLPVSSRLSDNARDRRLAACRVSRPRPLDVIVMLRQQEGLLIGSSWIQAAPVLIGYRTTSGPDDLQQPP